MSTLFVSVGQCGNQVGSSFWEQVLNWNKTEGLERHAVKKAHTPFVHHSGSLPWIMVDSEGKVVRSCLSKRVGQLVPPENKLSHRRGYGSNWALGYGEQKGEESLMQLTLERIRKEVEKLDMFSGTVVFHSLAGGTGSGFGSRLVELLRDEYPLAYILSMAVTPFHTGETPLQHYNSLLCLSWLQKYVDGIMLFSNDSVLASVQKMDAKSKAASAAAVSFKKLNSYISSTISTTLIPVYDNRKHRKLSVGKEAWEVIQSACPTPSMKFLTPLHSWGTKVSTSWDQLIHHFANSSLTRRFSVNNETVFPTTSSLLLTARSSPNSMAELERSLKSMETKLINCCNPVAWNPFPTDIRMSYEPWLNDRKYLTICANNSSITDYMNTIWM
ncbi:tubulin delta chain-like isoform X2 [Dysidea avara]|uniref:tubulin delta chain-like isoform X2 n=1 Tax=Dysidea avara TaxID=196820 RepID=UPI003333E41A